MAEILGVIASTITIANTSVKLGVTLAGIVKQTRSARTELRSLSRELEALAGFAAIVKVNLETTGPFSLPSETAFIRHVLTSCEDGIAELQDWVLEHSGRLGTMRGRLLCSFNVREVRDMKERLVVRRQELMMALTCVVKLVLVFIHMQSAITVDFTAAHFIEHIILLVSDVV